jgi:hypothetical protein
MMHQPTKVSKQTIGSVLEDIKRQQKRLEDAFNWTSTVAKAIQTAGRRVVFTNVGPIEPTTREVGIAFSLVVNGVMQDVLVVTLVVTPSKDDLASMRRETALAMEGIRLETMLAWQEQGVRVFETWFVKEQTLWQGSPEKTQVYLTKVIADWLAYWFETPPSPIFRAPELRIRSISPKAPLATPLPVASPMGG